VRVGWSVDVISSAIQSRFLFSFRPFLLLPTKPTPHNPHNRLQTASSPLCYPYDPVARPGLLRIHGMAFNFTPAAEADPERLFQGRGVVIAASGSIMR
jgi:hypothetical protein